jgi:murein DD-endopeptidase MepM/ murein hydrolase activator NlpD
MARRLAIPLVVALLLTAPAWGQGADERQREIDAKITQLRAKIADVNRREGVLTSEISAVTAKIRALEDDVDRASARLATLEGELVVLKNRLAALTQVYRLQTEKLNLLRRQHAVAERRLQRRLVAIYQADAPSTMEVVLSASSFTDLIDSLDYVNDIGLQDRLIAHQVATAKRQTAEARARTERTRARVAATTRAVETRTNEQRAVYARLVTSREELASTRSVKEGALGSLHETRREFLHEVAGLERASAALAARIRSAQTAGPPPTTFAARPSAVPSSAVSSSGFVWPVAGPVTSGFGWRWGRMHEGVDIAAPTGAPIVASASGVVIYAGWMDGYGNLVVVDHGGGLSTAYAHQSSIGVAVGQSVAQGQTIGYVGCTGHCFGSHLHFEVRVNGAAVDPLGYL